MDPPACRDGPIVTLELLAPAKINLGLEVIGKRDDGYHDIATVFQTISLFDRIRIWPADTDSVHFDDQAPRIEVDLAERALRMARSAGLVRGSYRISIEKRIPLAAGLGGASSDAAAVLTALAKPHVNDSNVIGSLALQLGSDVPFLLQGGAALATGRGEMLHPIPALRNCWIVLACPDVQIDRKTARLYASLIEQDFSDGQRVTRVATALRHHVIPNADDLANSFMRPLEQFLPECAHLASIMGNAGAPFVALSGAGPTHYSIIERLRDAIEISRELLARTTVPLHVHLARPMASGIQIRAAKTSPSGNAL